METPKTLYKYVTADRALTCIPEVGDGTLRATQPAALNDPFECAVIATTSRAEEFRALATMLTSINERKPVTDESVGEAKLRHGSLFLRQLVAEQVSTKFGIVSFTTEPFHPLMWSHYTSNGAGFVIGYDVWELGKLVGGEECLREVQYRELPPNIYRPGVLTSPPSNTLVLLSMKSKHWSYEQEWRLIVELDKTIGTGQMDQLGQPINLIRLPNEAVVSVHYTERTPPASVQLIRARMKDQNNRYRATKPIKLIMSVGYGYEEAPD